MHKTSPPILCQSNIQCPCCEGSGQTFSFVCCQCFEDGGNCCANPDVDQIDCPLCKGELFVNLKQFEQYAVQSTNPALLAQYEALLILDQILLEPQSACLQPHLKVNKRL